ncbi:MAG TPA: hypothetical protein DCZ95_12655 [Verrucomicrobia bacterium]|nr:hypothetical protein [Verrucomicrobiota bacterium]
MAQERHADKRRYVKEKTTKAKPEDAKVDIKMKTCRSDRCEHAGQAQPIENFMRSKMSRDGYMHLCKVCYSVQARDRVGLKARNAASLEIRFDKYPDILPALADLAERECRTVEMQALAIIRAAVLPQMAAQR